MNLIPISKKDKLAHFGVFLSRDRLIKLWRGDRYPGLFVKLFGRLYIDVDLLHTAITPSPGGQKFSDASEQFPDDGNSTKIDDHPNVT